ncbi:hypothetical protein EJ02DRAFT_514884 [Clathrospora elynae]|uniref:Ubiquitin-like domain-containing protein n=1 Tax=Clathrospora elynae TaxID=706981 RepID=A0A6A5SDC2_9PLEO|nr:hypothetical protein EJ02DRAFT_514884 [Clathrospora elynae]
MENQAPLSETRRRISWLEEHPRVSASNERQDDTIQDNLPTPRQLSATNNDDGDSQQTITFVNHKGDRYIWPFELSRSFDAIKPLLEEIYIRLDERNLKDELLKEEYDIQTKDGAIILPSVWNDIVKPSSTIGIRFWNRDKVAPLPLPSTTSRRQSMHAVNLRFRGDPYWNGGTQSRRQSTYDSNVEIYAAGSEPPLLAVYPSESGDDHNDLESQNSSDNDDESSQQLEVEPPTLPEPIREVNPPVDADGNKLSFQVCTIHPMSSVHANEHPGSNENTSEVLDAKREAPETHAETLKITKAISTETDSRNMIQVHTLPGPENTQLRAGVKITWHHIPARRLDFTKFKTCCLAIPYLSGRLQTLTKEMLAKIEKEKVKVFLDGMFIEPGTVLRADEKDPPDPQSVIFSCIPYFDLQPPAKKTSTSSGDRLFPSRTLMQSYYPYEPVRERDEEQAYRKFGNDRSGGVIHVPTFWMMNIGTDVVVTCGHKPLSEEMIKSIAVVQEDLKQLGMKDVTKGILTKVRLTDWDGRVLVFSLDACRSYFQMERKIGELNYIARGSMDIKCPHIEEETAGGRRKVTPGSWRNLINQTSLVFIDLALPNGKGEKDLRKKMTAETALEENILFPSGSVPPFFHWPRTPTDNTFEDSENIQNFAGPDAKRSTGCLEYAEKVMMSKTLSDNETTNAVDQTFTSTEYYQALPERTYEHVRADFTSLGRNPTRSEPPSTHHQIVIHNQRISIVKHSMKFFEVVHATLKLFVSDIDKSTMLRKVWGAMANMHELAATIEQREAIEPDQDEYADREWKQPAMMERAWFVRDASKERFVPLPDADESFKRSVRRCRRCKNRYSFDSPGAALAHLQKHVKLPAPESELSGRPAQGPSAERNLKDWVVNSAQVLREETNAGALVILTQACDVAVHIFIQAKELAEGVQNEDGGMSELYTLPQSLVEAFRRIVILFMAIERAMHYTEDTYGENGLPAVPLERSILPYSESGQEVLKRFGEGARRSLLVARQELCHMVRSNPPLDVFKHLSLGPEYVCAWLMRRLLVKPLERCMTVGDMYREYLSTIQFQVNHRPGKRLLRDINLLQEELQVLIQVNTWQTNLVQNYTRVLDDTTYEKDIPPRRSMFPYERSLLTSCLDNLDLAREEYLELIRRCDPLSDRTKQSLEINEEDHGKAIMVFTIVTVIFLPLSFVTSYLGMNTADIRDMDSQQSLFWSIAIPLTVVTVGSCLLIGYNGDEIGDAVASAYRTATGKQTTSTPARGISVAQRKRAGKLQSDSSSTLDNSLADEAEFASPRPEYEFGRSVYLPPSHAPEPVDYTYIEPPTLRMQVPTLRAGFQTQTYADAISFAEPMSRPRPLFTSNAVPRRYHPSAEPAQQRPYESDRRRIRRDGYEPPPYETRREDRSWDPPRRPYEYYPQVRYAPPPPIAVPYAYADDEGETDVGDYTWHKKQSRKRRERERETGGGDRGERRGRGGVYVA